MASLASIIPGGFDASTVEPQESRDYSPMPAGLYTVEVTNSEVKDLKSGNGTGLSLEFTVMEPEGFARRKVWQQLNIKHTNSEAEQIAQAQLSALCRAVGISVLKDSDDLFQKILRIRLKIRPAKDGYPANNDVTGYESTGAGAPPPQATAASRPAANGTTAAKTPPWKRAA